MEKHLAKVAIINTSWNKLPLLSNYSLENYVMLVYMGIEVISFLLLVCKSGRCLQLEGRKYTVKFNTGATTINTELVFYKMET